MAYFRPKPKSLAKDSSKYTCLNKRVIVKCGLFFLFGLFCTSEVFAQMNLRWIDNCQKYIDFSEEPPKQGDSIGFIFPNRTMLDRVERISLTDSFGKELFKVVSYIVNGRERKGYISIVTNDGKEIIISEREDERDYRKSLCVIKAEGTDNMYYIAWKMGNNSTLNDSYIEYLKYDAAQSQVIKGSRRRIKDSENSLNLEMQPLKVKHYADGIAFLLHYSISFISSKSKHFKLTIYQMLKDTVKEIFVDTQFHFMNGSQALGVDRPISFCHKEKALVFLSDRGIERIRLDTGAVIKRELLLASIWEKEDVSGHAVALSPNDSLLYFSMFDRRLTSAPMSLIQFDLAKSKIMGIYRGEEIGVIAKTMPNGKIIFSTNTVIQQPNLPWPKCKYENSRPFKCFDSNISFDNIRENTISPQHYVWFHANFTCSDSLRLINKSDSIFKKFQWTIENLTQKDTAYFAGSDVSIAAKTGDSLYIKLKGTTRNGHSLWFSDYINYRRLKPPVLRSLLEDSICNYNEYIEPFTFEFDSLDQRLDQSMRWIIDGVGYRNDTIKGKIETIKTSAVGQLSIMLMYENEACRLDTQISIKIISTPKSSFSLSDTFSCSPAEITIRATDSGKVIKREFSTSHGLISNVKTWKVAFDSAAWYKITQTLTGANGCSSSAYKRLRIAQGYTEQDRGNLLTATVLDSQRVLIKWISQPQGAGYVLLRTAKEQSEMELNVMNPSQDSLIDSLAIQCNRQSYSYRLKLIDSCGHLSGNYNSATTILLEQVENNKEHIILQWSAYQSWQNGVMEYLIERSEDGLRWTALDAQSNLSYADENMTEMKADVYYRIKAAEKDGNQQSSYSNVLKLQRKTILFIPNAFSPNGDGINDIFKIGQIGLQEFECTIYSCTGQIVATSSDPTYIWDGKINEEYYPIGSYRYVIKAIDFQGEEVRCVGSVSLLR